METAVMGKFSNTLQGFDERIRKAKEELNELEYQRNLLVPICHLPAEILGNIFTFCVPTGTISTPQLPNVVHVCRLWRTIAFNTPLMWSTPNFISPKLAREMLRLSKSSPLNIEWNRDSGALLPKQLEVLGEAITEISRVQSLHLSCNPHQVEVLLTGLVDPAPMLEALTLQCPISGDFFFLPGNFLAGDAPRLRRLSLTASNNIPWGSQIMKNLTRLDIVYRNGQSRPLTPWPEIIETLRGAPCLEVLRLDFLSSRNACLEVGPPIILPNLGCVDLAADAVSCSTLLHRMSFPNTTSICLECRLPASYTDSTYDPLFAYMTGLFGSTSSTVNHPRAIKSLLLSYSPDHINVLSIGAWNVGGVMEYVLGESNISLTNQFSGTLVLKNVMGLPFLQKVLASLGPLSQLETLTIDLSTLPVDIMIQRFGSLTNLSSIFVKGACAPEVVKSLSHDLSETSLSTIDASPRHGTTILPRKPFAALRTFGLVHVDFTWDREALLNPLLDMLRRRAQNELPLEKVVLELCTHIFLDDVAQIRKEVHVEWDDRELYGEDSEDEYSEETTDDYPYDSDYDYDDY
ncbi:hypothetical protein E1B28_000943 [Marasmius oreades]|uniref:F-box domain-containing protein n=1 Tax=Marasmius oreades TaxID=181124 RepID=A0A9P7V2E5_9AGAR|nr:uncharacterized protein E1B28_000943 [Marasmius oreades]KAG7099068.1 hypothetical protein E1B28_000943 [Marasmius oreades]